MKYNPFITLYILDIYTTWLVVPRFVIKYKEYIFPKKLVLALGSWFPLFAKSLTFFYYYELYCHCDRNDYIFIEKRKKESMCHSIVGLVFQRHSFHRAPPHRKK